MLPEIQDELTALVDAYFPNEPLNGMLKAFVREKQAEGSVWADMTMTAYRMYGGHSPLVYKCAAATELILLALDIADDLQDRDNLAKPWMTVPEPYALNAVLSLSVLTAAQLGHVWSSFGDRGGQLLEFVGRLLSEAVYGQQLDIGDAVASEEDYIEMVQHKSGSLMQLAVMMGYTMAEAPLAPEVAAAMDELARYAGVISQLSNDLNDCRRVDVKNDLLNRKKTLATMFLLRGSADEFPPLLDYYEGRLGKEQFLALKPQILAYVESSGCIEYTGTIQHLIREQAAPLLASLPVSEEWRAKFKEQLHL